MQIATAGRRFVVPLIAAAIISAQWSAATAQPKPELPPVPAPHAITMRSDRAEVQILHREDWTRTERHADGGTHIHMTGPAGHAYTVMLTADGAPTSMQLFRNDAPQQEATRTGAADTVLGERCEIWSIPPPRDSFHMSSTLSCIASDGIALWHGSNSEDGTLTIYSRAVAIERRSPAWEEFSFPQRALDWSYWSPHFAAAPGATPAYEIRFGERIYRVIGDARFESVSGRVWFRTPNAHLNYANLDGPHSYVELSIGPREPYPHPLTGGSEPLAREPLTISGERCDWHRVDLGVRWGIVSVCVTPDGVKFAEFTDYDDNERFQDKLQVATHFQRGAPGPALMSPPENLFAPWLTTLPK